MVTWVMNDGLDGFGKRDDIELEALWSGFDFES